MGGDQEPRPDKCPRGGGRPGLSRPVSHFCGWVKVILWQPESLNRNDIPSQADGQLRTSWGSLDQESSQRMMGRGSQPQSTGRGLEDLVLC